MVMKNIPYSRVWLRRKFYKAKNSSTESTGDLSAFFFGVEINFFEIRAKSFDYIRVQSFPIRTYFRDRSLFFYLILVSGLE